ncbi:hypothetical protein DEIPH_ctg018orf0068 [Deinococcus phoenicis]|uniref:Uncharacterized protein n=1 Tax=Deinococcus phoenicis TaxID=1476583 RepID=A0A016QS06_9DEIO|nr:hypothetical protein DEIPH_ctg018orf0068 [Deinococcus phoenicis]
MNNRWMAAFLKDVGDAFPELRRELNPIVGRHGPSGLALLPVLHHLQRMVAHGETVPLAQMVALLEQYYCPDDERLKPFNDIVEQCIFDSLTFHCRGGRASWLVFTPRLRRAYRRWITEGLGFPWRNFAPYNPGDLPDG